MRYNTKENMCKKERIMQYKESILGILTGNKKKRKVLRAICLASAMLLCFGMSVLAAEEKEWTIGYEENKNGPKDEKQGANGWYFLYSEEVNTDGKLDSSKLKECVWADRGSCWIYYGFPSMWYPKKYTKEDYDFAEKSNWWRMDGNGIMDPNAGDDCVRSVIAWEAQESGTYSVNLDYTAGSNSYEWEGETYYNEDADGVTLSLNTENEVLDKVLCKRVTEKEPDLSTGSLSAEVKLEKGERLYVSADPGKNGSNDEASIKMNIKQTDAESASQKSDTEKESDGNNESDSSKADSGSQMNYTYLLLGAIGILAVLIGIIFVIVRGHRE